MDTASFAVGATAGLARPFDPLHIGPEVVRSRCRAHSVCAMTDVPDHLLRRSRERREALGLDAGAGGEGTGSTPAEAPAAAPGGASVPATTAAAEVAAPAAAAATPAPVAVDEPVPEPAYIRLGRKQRSKNPIWVMPVLIALPLWAYFYAFAFSPPKKEGPVDPKVLGAQVYRTAGCSGCHGAAGE